MSRLLWFLVLFLLALAGNFLNSNFVWSMLLVLAFYVGGFREAFYFHKWWRTMQSAIHEPEEGNLIVYKAGEYEQWWRENDPRFKTQTEEGPDGTAQSS